MLARTLPKSVFSVVAAAALLPAIDRCAAAETAGLSVGEMKTGMEVSDAGRPVLVYRCRGGGTEWKPYVEKLFSPAGVQILRDSPFDHKHHHALMFAVRVDGVNFWEEYKPEDGREQHRSLAEIKSGAPENVERAGFVETLDWIAPSPDRPLLAERREIAAYKAPDLGATLIEWRCRLEPPPGKDSAVLSGAHYNGLGMRFIQSMDTGGRFVNADDKAGEAAPNGSLLTPTKWCAYTAKADGKPVTVAIFDHPANFRHPATMFTLTKGFAYLSATMNEWKEPITIKAGHPLNLCYGIALWDGEADKATVEKLYQRWVKLSAGEEKP